VPFTSHWKLHEFGAKKLISWTKPAHFDFFAINFTVWSHILCTGGDALTLVYRLVMLLVQKNCLDWFDVRQYQAHTIW
jgi:hypothetical protein